MSGEIFVDTNIIVYAHDVDAKDKYEKAKDSIEGLWNIDKLPWLSVQVLQELFVNLNRKGVNISEARKVVHDYSSWQVVENTVLLVDRGISEMKRWKISFWDGMIIAAAREAGASTIWSEDLSQNQDYDGVVIVNPLNI